MVNLLDGVRPNPSVKHYPLCFFASPVQAFSCTFVRKKDIQICDFLGEKIVSVYIEYISLFTTSVRQMGSRGSLALLFVVVVVVQNETPIKYAANT